MSKLRLLQAAATAEKAWMVEVEALFGARNASYARFQERANGEPGTQLRALYEAYAKAREAYVAAR